MKDQLDINSRIEARQRPDSLPIMYQSWGKLLFMHWQVPIKALRPLIPEPLEIDTYDGRAWVSLSPFTIWDARPIFVPPLPWISDFHETNLRTYVYLDGVPGVWFFSLDASSRVAVLGARTFFSLPYYNSDISLKEEDKTIIYSLNREGATPPVKLDASWTIGKELPKAEAGSLRFFLVERYCLYTASDDGKTVYRCRIFHQPWPLQEAKLLSYESNIIEANSLPTPDNEPLVHCAGPVDVEIWPLEEVYKKATSSAGSR